MRLAVVGGGVAGCTAALKANSLGMSVTLIDEHPQSRSMMSLDTPWFYGNGLPQTLNNQNLVSESILDSNPGLVACMEAGVDVLPGTCVWGNYRRGPNSQHISESQLGLADGERSWMLGYDHLILATGARDLVLPFRNWPLPGVLGAQAASALLDRYACFENKQLLIVGSGNLALRVAQSALKAGVTIAGMIEVSATIKGDAGIAAKLAASGVPFHLSHTIVSATGRTEVGGAQLVKVSADSAPISASTRDIACDSICLAIGSVPNIELAAVSGCKITFDASRGGWVPEINSHMQTSEASIHIIGEAAMVTEAMLLDPEIAAAQARVAVQHIAGKALAATEIATPTISIYPPLDWHRSLVAAGGLDVMVCQCEDVTRREILDVSPPRYLNAGNPSPVFGLDSLTEPARRSQDQIKRLTRAGMGHCQGRRCRDHTAFLLAGATGADVSEIVPGSYRMPVRPLPLKVLRDDNESAEMTRGWRTWVHAADGIPEA